MEKYDDDDILDDTKDELLLPRMYDRFPGYFSKILNSGDNILAISRTYSIIAYAFIDDNIYGIWDPAISYDYANNLPINDVYKTDAKWLSYGSKFGFCRLFGLKVEGGSVCTDTPFTGTTITSRNIFPPVDFALMYYPGIPPLSISANDFANSDTNFKMWGNGDVTSKVYVFPQTTYCGKYRSTTINFGTGYFLYCGGHFIFPTLDVIAYGGEAFQITVTVYLELKDYLGFQQLP